MAIPGQIPPNLIFLIGITEPIRWTVPARPWTFPGDGFSAVSTEAEDIQSEQELQHNKSTILMQGGTSLSGAKGVENG